MPTVVFICEYMKDHIFNLNDHRSKDQKLPQCTVLPQLSYQANCQRSISAFKENGQLTTKPLSCWLIWSQLGIWDFILCMRIILTQESNIMLSYTWILHYAWEESVYWNLTLCMRRILTQKSYTMYAKSLTQKCYIRNAKHPHLGMLQGPPYPHEGKMLIKRSL